MKLRTRLFLSSGALLTVALAGLLLAIFSVQHLTTAQGQAMTRNLAILQASQAMEHELSRQTTLLLAELLDQQALDASVQRFHNLLEEAAEHATGEADRQAVTDVAQAYAAHANRLGGPLSVRSELFSDEDFSWAIASVRDRLNAVQTRYASAVERIEQSTRENARIISWLLGLTGIAIVLIGMVTAHSVARHFAEPIESLALAADQVGRGDFQVTLPISRENELNALIRRFGLMAEALREFKNSDVEALQAEQRRLQAVLDSIDDGLLILDRRGRLQHFNPVAGRQLGWTGEEPGRRPGALLDSPAIDQQVGQVLRGESLASAAEDIAVDVAGESRLLAYSITPVSQNGERIRGAVIVLRDVTEQRAFERVRNEFVLRASHELRTPVTGMQMGFALLSERLQFPPDSREADLVRTVDEEMQRLLVLVKDLLDFSRYQTGQQQLDIEPCDVGELLDQVSQRLEATAAEGGVALHRDYPDDLPRLQLDRLQIERVLDNLVSNALRHTPPGGEVHLQASRSGERVILAVEDNGEGIPYGEQARVFEPFVQVGTRKGGAGLGLALCKEILLLHGGQIGVRSRPGHGARLFFTLPV